MSKKEQFADIDDKSKAVFTKKGYQLMGKLGEGAFGLVYKAKNFKKNDQLCAVKVMDMNKMSPKLRDKFLPRELAALMEVKHPHCVRVYDIFKMNHKVYVFMEFAGNGDLSGYVKKHKILKDELARWWFKQTSEAVCYTLNISVYLHNEAKMAHRDIKLDNILLDENNQTKLTDFGFADPITDDTDIGQLVSETFCGTVPYYSPQLVAKKPYNPFKADVWAMGVVMYAMLCNRFPFHFQDTKNLYKEQTNYPAYIKSRFLDSVTDSARNLLLKLLDPSEKTRPMMADVLQHEWCNADIEPEY